MKIRGFEKLNDLGIIPTRATINSAGYDFYVVEDIVSLVFDIFDAFFFVVDELSALSFAL